MHELSICQALILQVEKISQERKATCVNKIIVKVGPLSGVEAHLLARAYPLVTAGSIAEHAELVVEELPVCVRCEACDAESIVQANKLICGVCGDWRTQLLSGDEILLASVDMNSTASIGEKNV